MPYKLPTSIKPLPKKADPKLAPSKQRAVTGLQGYTEGIYEWWNQPKEALGNVIASLVQRIDQNNFDLRDRWLRYAQMYGNVETMGFSNLNNRFDRTNNVPVFNVIQSCVDTLNSKIAKDNPAPYFITSGADYFEKVKAEKMTQFIQGLFQQMNFYDIANNQVFRDASVYGDGGVQFEFNPKTKKIECDWIFIDQLKIDQFDALNGKPRSMHRVRLLQKEMLISKYPDQEELINNVFADRQKIFRTKDTVIDLVKIIESWHLCNDSRTGRHTVVLADKVLSDEDYEYDWFPIVLFHYYKKAVGIFGRGIPEEIQSPQIEINKELLFIQQAQELQCSPLIIVDTDSQISNESLLTNRVARMVKVRGGTRAPQFLSPQGLSEEVYAHLKWWIDIAYQSVGISQMSASGEKTPGVTSAVAMRTMVDIESSRFVQVSKNWEEFFVQCAETCLKIGKDAYAGKDWKVSYTDKKSKVIREISWDKINLKEDSYVIRCDTVSSFPQSAAGRIQTITDFISNNFISKERGMELLQLDPDLEGEVRLQTAPLRLIEKILCDMVEENIYQHPEPYYNLQLALTVTQATLQQLQIDNCPDDRLQLVRQFLNELATLLSGQDPTVALLQQSFQSGATAAQIAPQAGVAPIQ